jgi:hypothetical protein
VPASKLISAKNIFQNYRSINVKMDKLVGGLWMYPNLANISIYPLLKYHIEADAGADTKTTTKMRKRENNMHNN